MNTMGIVYRSLGLFDPAQVLLERALDVRKKALGPDHPVGSGTLADASAGCIVFFPAGAYRINGRLSVPQYVELRGAQDSLVKEDCYTVLCFFADKDQPNNPPIITMAADSDVPDIPIPLHIAIVLWAKRIAIGETSEAAAPVREALQDVLSDLGLYYRDTTRGKPLVPDITGS